MPSWKIHAQVANKLNSMLNYYEDKDKFLLGNILPDMYGGHVVKNVSKIIEYQVSHYREYTIINGESFVFQIMKHLKMFIWMIFKILLF